jgi:glc operon protein GlcG
MRRLLIFLMGVLMSAPTATSQLRENKTLTLDLAKKAAAAAEAEAVKNGWKIVVAVVDDGANLIYLQRMDDALIASIDIAIAKAQTAVRYKRPTKALEDLLAGGRTAVLAMPGVFPMQGGIPIAPGELEIAESTDQFRGHVVGAIGVSGATTAATDAQCAKAGVNAVMKILENKSQ